MANSPKNQTVSAQVATIGDEEQQLKVSSKQQSLDNKDQKQFRLDNQRFWMGFSWLWRQFYIHYLKILVLLRKNVISKDKMIELEHLPQLEASQKTEHVLKLYEIFLDTLGSPEGITGKDIYNMIHAAFNIDFFAVHFLIIIEIGCKAVYSIVIQKIIDNFQQEKLTGDSSYENAALFALLLFGLLFLALLCRNKYSYLLEAESTAARQGLMLLLYKKVSSMTNQQVQSANIGKLFNIMSGDLAQIEMLMQYAFIAVWTPLLLIATTIVICFRLKWYGLIGIGCIIVVYPMQNILGRHMHKHFAAKMQHSDSKIRILNESLTNIKLIKLYGWERVMEKNIAEVRTKEQVSIFKVVLNRAVDRAFANAVILIAAFLPILVIYLAGDEAYVELDAAKIFATLEQMSGLKFMMILSGVGIGFLFQWVEISNRFASFLAMDRKPTQQVVRNSKYSEEIAEKQKQIQAKPKETLTQEDRDLLQIEPFCLVNDKEKQVKLQKQKKTQEEENVYLLEDLESYPSTQDPQNAIELSADFESFWNRTERKQESCVKLGRKLTVPKGSFFAVVGKVGSGKSSFLSTLIREVTFYSGEGRVSGSLAYVEQEPYTFSGTVVENILFGKPMDRKFFNSVVYACCLEDDFDIFPNGENTEIGERGITLSGGQRARLSLARAVYSNSDIVLLDDPLSAVDAPVARQLHQRCLLGILKGKTIILATHQIHLTRDCDQIIILENGKISSIGKFEELKQDLFMHAESKKVKVEKTVEKDLKNEEEGEGDGDKQVDFDRILETVIANDEAANKVQHIVKEKQTEKKTESVVSSEKDEQVRVSLFTLKRYLGEGKKWHLVLLMLSMFAASEVIFTFFYRVFGNYNYTDSDGEKSDLFRDSGILLACYTVATFLKYFSLAAVTYYSNKSIHEGMVEHILRANLSYFERNPNGRIINKFAGDIGTMDFILFFLMTDCTENPMQFTNLLLTVALYNYWFFILAAVYAFFLFGWFFYCRELIVQSKSLDSIYRAPLLTFFSKSIEGIVHLRVYKQVKYFLSKFAGHSDDQIRTNHWYYQSGRAFSFLGQVLSCIVTFAGIIICIYTSPSQDRLGQTIVYLTLIIELNNYLVRQMISLDSTLSSAERAYTLCDITNEGALILPGTDSKWNFSKGALEFQNVSLRYREGLDLSLRNVSFQVKNNELVGCVGRTGAGKSSLLQALFRLNEIEPNGKIILDGQDISKLGLNTLRSSMSIIPQSSFVFKGTIRQNVDPLGKYSDTQINEVINLTGLSEIIKSQVNGLNTDMSNAASVFSVGQKQLICLARAILSNSKLVVLDEATANLDVHTDTFIQKTIKTAFKDSSIFTIAHRLNTIADYDKVLVMDGGKVAEFDAPFRLLANSQNDTSITSSSLFAQMVKQTGKLNSSLIFEAAKAKYFASHPS